MTTPQPAESRATNVRPLPTQTKITRDRLTFQTPEERTVYDELNRQRRVLSRHDSVGLASQVPVNVLGHTFTLDLVVTSRGRAAVVEVDGAVHTKRWSNDRSRDALLEDAGYAFVARIDVRDVENAEALRVFVERVLYRLRERATG
jgi:very-short-patch-repair endonuclease